MYRFKLSPVATEVVNSLGLTLKIDPLIVQKFGSAPKVDFLSLIPDNRFFDFNQGNMDISKKNFYDQIIAEMGANYEQYLLPDAKWYKSRKMITNSGQFVLFLLDNGDGQKYISLVHKPLPVEVFAFGGDCCPYFTDYAYTVPLPSGNLYSRVLQGIEQNAYWPAWQIPGMSFGDVNYEPLRGWFDHLSTAVYTSSNYVEISKKSVLVSAYDSVNKSQTFEFYSDKQLTKQLKASTEFAGLLSVLKNFSIEDSNLDLQDFEIQSMRVYVSSGTHICYLQKS